MSITSGGQNRTVAPWRPPGTATWNSDHFYTTSAFAELEHRFDSGWQVLAAAVTAAMTTGLVIATLAMAVAFTLTWRRGWLQPIARGMLALLRI